MFGFGTRVVGPGVEVGRREAAADCLGKVSCEKCIDGHQDENDDECEHFGSSICSIQ